MQAAAAAMELSRTSPDSERSDPSIDDDLPVDAAAATIALNGMPAVVAHHHQPQPATPNGQQAQKRYRPAPAKTFQCRGYGECRMVFSRSEHLARHIRKHTGERPFSCHCGKQFSRLDNLRQHAQTVHADKQEQNEQMMRDLTSLHASMAAANKGGGRGSGAGGRRAAAAASAATPATTGHQVGVGGNAPPKQEDGVGLGLSLRPGTSTGYEGDLWTSSTSLSPSAPAGGLHSFRDSRESSQSFLASHGSFRAYGADAHHPPHRPFTSAAAAAGYASGAERRPSTAAAPPSLSRPTTSSGPPDPSRTLPPLAAVVSASLAPSPPPGALGHHHAFGGVHAHHGLRNELPFPFRRPTTATRPGTAPAFFAKSSSASAYAGGYGGMAAANREREFLSSRDGLGSRHAGHGGEAGGSGGAAGGWDYEQGHDSPFYFNAPSVADHQPGVASTGSSSTPGSSAPSTSTSASSHGLPTPTAAAASSPGVVNPRKRGFGGPDGPAGYDDDVGHAPREPPRSSHGVYGGSAAGFVEREPPRSAHGYGGHHRASREYEYGTESRPASRRISVMELCNDTDADPPRSSHGGGGAGTFAFNVPPAGRSGFTFNPPPTAPSSTSTAAAGTRTPGVLSPSTSGGSSSAGGGRPASAYAAFGLSSRTTSSSAYSSSHSFRRSPSSASTSPSGFLYSSSRPGTGTTATGRRRGRRRTASPESRPTTSSGLVASAATLHIFDRGSPIAVDAYERGEESYERERYERERERQYRGEYGRRRRYESADSPSARVSPYAEQYGGRGEWDDGSGRGREVSPASESSASAATPIFAFSAPPGDGRDGDAGAAARGREGYAAPAEESAEEVASQRVCESPGGYEERAANGRGRERGVYAAAATAATTTRAGASGDDVFERAADAPGGAGAGYARGYGADERGYGEYERDYRGGAGGQQWRRTAAVAGASGDGDGEEEFGAVESERVFPASSARTATGGRGAAAAGVRRGVSGADGWGGAGVLRGGGDGTAAAAVDDACRERERVGGYGGVFSGGDDAPPPPATASSSSAAPSRAPASATTTTTAAAGASAPAARGRGGAEDEGADGDAWTDGGDEEAARDEADARVDGDSVSSSAVPTPAAAASALSSTAVASSRRSPSAAAAFASSAAATPPPPAAYALSAGARSVRPAASATAAGDELDADGAAGVPRGVSSAADAECKRESEWEYRERGERYAAYGRGELSQRGEWGRDVRVRDVDVDVEMRDVKREGAEVEMGVVA